MTETDNDYVTRMVCTTNVQCTALQQLWIYISNEGVFRASGSTFFIFHSFKHLHVGSQATRCHWCHMDRIRV